MNGWYGQIVAPYGGSLGNQTREGVVHNLHIKDDTLCVSSLTRVSLVFFLMISLFVIFVNVNLVTKLGHYFPSSVFIFKADVDDNC